MTLNELQNSSKETNKQTQKKNIYIVGIDWPQRGLCNCFAWIIHSNCMRNYMVCRSVHFWKKKTQCAVNIVSKCVSGSKCVLHELVTWSSVDQIHHRNNAISQIKKKHEWDIDRFFDQITFTFSTVVGIERHDSENIVELNSQLNAIKYYVS